MKAIQVKEYGEAGALQLATMPAAEPGPGQARVQLAAAGVNFVDIYQRRGWYPVPLPFTPGQEGAGIVNALGPGVTGLNLGDRVAYTSSLGAYAEEAVVDAGLLVPVPPEIELELAAAVMLQGMTAHYLSHSTFPLQPGQTALVHAAAGGVGGLLVQMAKARGARVIGTVSSEAKAEVARQAGADEVILYTQVDFAAETRRLTGGAGVDVVYDSVGADTFDASLNCLKPRGMLVLYGQASGPVPPLDLQRLNQQGSLFVTRPTLRHYLASRQELLARSQALFAWIKDGSLRVRIDRRFPLAQAAEAHRYLEGRQTKGKVLLVPAL